ncbi:MAG: hypothetical protein FWB94_00405 [Chitinispirillia bacterium]|nr:hypothetical protein [Chitinispirillia bacterium]
MAGEIDKKMEKAWKEILEETPDVASQDKILRRYKDRGVVGKLIFDSLWKYREGTDGDGMSEGFYLTSKDKEAGLMSRLYGLNGLLSLINRFNVEPDDEQKEFIKRGVGIVCAHIEKHGYDLSPYLDSSINDHYFRSRERRRNGDRYSYIGARTWGLSLFLAARKAHLLYEKHLEDPEKYNQIGIDFTGEMKLIKKNIKDNVEFFVDNVIKIGGEELGWGYTDATDQGLKEPSLFYTYSVTEVFSDFEDACMHIETFDTKGNVVEKDKALLEYINADDNVADTDSKPLATRFKDICFKIGDLVWKKFKDGLKTELFTDSLINPQKVSRDEIEKTSRSSVLFNNLYAIFILFYTYKNNRPGGKNEKNNEEVRTAMSLGLQMIQTLYDELETAGKESIVDRHIVAFDQKHQHHERFNKELNDASILASTLLPMLVKANNLIAYYVYRFPQQKMGRLLDKMLIAKFENEWLWENYKFDLLSTERYLEAIADFYDYYEKYEIMYVKNVDDLEKMVEDRVQCEKKLLEDKIKGDVDERHRKDIENVKSEETKNYPVEKILREEIRKRALDAVTDALKNLSTYNRLENKNENEKKDERELKLQETLHGYIESCFAESFRIVVDKNSKVEPKKLEDAARKYINDAVEGFLQFVAENAWKGDSRLSLNEIFNVIKEHQKMQKDIDELKTTINNMRRK